MSFKPTKRKGFSFLRSYYDVFNKLQNDDDKLKFIELIFDKMFHDIDPKENLSFAVDLAYESQRHQIEQSVKGYKSKTKDPMQDPCQGGSQGGTEGPCLQEEEEEKEKEQEKGKEDDVYKDIDILKKDYLHNKRLCNAVIKNNKSKVPDLDTLKERLQEFNDMLAQSNRHSETKTEYAKYFLNWVRRTEVKQKPKFGVAQKANIPL